MYTVYQLHYFLKQFLVNIHHGVCLRILFISLVQFYFGGVSLGDTAVYAPYLILGVRKIPGSFKQIVSDACQMLLACELVVAHRRIVGFGEVNIHIRDTVEQAHKFKIPVVAYHAHFRYARILVLYDIFVGSHNGPYSGVAA